MREISLTKLYEYFKETAPGSYRHCETVASLCEAIAKELELDTENLVLAARLHDIGKTFNPDMFSENQPKDDNVHDSMSPEQSYLYISRHVGDSLIILTPLSYISKEVLSIISQHHGNSCIASLYNKVKKKTDGESVKDGFRYKGCKPSINEAAVLMIADVVEAATRSFHDSNTLDDIPTVIDGLIENLIEDHQLDMMRIGDVRVIKKVLYKEIDNMYHKRVVYDDANHVESVGTINA